MGTNKRTVKSKVKNNLNDNLPKGLQEALDDFPRIVAEKKRRYIERKKFVEKTFGALIRQVRREIKLDMKNKKR